MRTDWARARGRGHRGGPDRARARRRQRRSRCAARSVSPRPLAARRRARAACAALGVAGGGADPHARAGDLALDRRDARSRVSRPRGAQSRQRRRSCSPTAAARRSIRPRRWRASPYIAVAELTGTAAQGRILLAAPITQAEIESRFADEIESRRGDHLRSRARWACAHGAASACTRSRLSEAAAAGRAVG